MRMSKKADYKKIYSWIIMVLVLVIVYFPIYWLVTMSFKSPADITSPSPTWFFKPTLSNYSWLFSHTDVLGGLKRSLIVALMSTGLSCLIGIPCGYGLTRFKFKHKEDLSFWIMSTRFLPPIAVLVPYVAIFLRLDLFNTYPALIIMHLIINLPLVIWLSSKFLGEVPLEMEEAAMVDGCSRLKAVINVVLPQAGPGLAVTMMFAFIFSWNEFFYAFVLTSSKATLPVVISSFLAHGHEIKWGSLAGAAVIASIPALIIVTAARETITRGFTEMV